MDRSRFMSGVSLGRAGTKRQPVRAASHQTSASCAIPVMGVAQASVRPRSQPNHCPSSIPAMNSRFSSTGAAAATPKRPFAFSTPEIIEASEISRM